MTEDYVSFEAAKLLKENGFKGECFAAYNGNGKLYDFGKEVDDNTPYWSDAPTLQMAMKWLREVHHITIGITFSLDIITYEIHKDKKFITAISSSRSYEDMIEEAIKCCLENLI